MCVNATSERQHGVLLDNLHVAPAYRRQGLGRALVSIAARWIAEKNFDNGTANMHLTCLDTNATAMAFYATLGGVKSPEPYLWQAEGGQIAPCTRFVWSPEAVRLLAASAATLE